jgi:hypothetical protein
VSGRQGSASAPQGAAATRAPAAAGPGRSRRHGALPATLSGLPLSAHRAPSPLTPTPLRPLSPPQTAAERNPCRCSLYLTLANNTRFCPTRATVGSLAIGTVDALTGANAPNITCRRDDFTQTTLKEYLMSPANFLPTIPPPPPPRARAPGPGGGGGGGRRRGALAPGAIAGICIGVAAALAIVGALGYFVARPIYRERRATGFFKTRELDLPIGAGAPPPANGAGGVSAAAVMESGWNRTI